MNRSQFAETFLGRRKPASTEKEFTEALLGHRVLTPEEVAIATLVRKAQELNATIASMSAGERLALAESLGKVRRQPRRRRAVREQARRQSKPTQAVRLTESSCTFTKSGCCRCSKCIGGSH